MLNFLPAPILFFISSLLLMINTIFWSSLICVGGLIKLLIPITSFRNLLSITMNRCMWGWACINGGILFLITKIEWDIEGLEGLKKDGWYLLISNHLSGFDIAALTYVLRNNIPMLKFFLKKELIYIPFLGFGCWALDMPFMNRTSAKQLKKNPKLRGKDLETTRRSCEKFKNVPTSIINYVEGSRFTREKRDRQRSPYRYLLRPKAGGIAFTISAMGEQFTNLLNVTLVYPDSDGNTLSEVMHGKVKRIVVRIETLPVPEVNHTSYFNDAESRAQFQRWLNGIWSKKDEQIHRILQQYQSTQLVHSQDEKEAAE